MDVESQRPDPGKDRRVEGAAQRSERILNEQVGNPATKPEQIVVVDREFNQNVNRLFTGRTQQVERSGVDGSGEIIEYLQEGREQVNKLGDPRTASLRSAESSLIGLYELADMQADVERDRLTGVMDRARVEEAGRVEQSYVEAVKKFFPHAKIATEFDSAEAASWLDIKEDEREEFGARLQSDPESVLHDLVAQYTEGVAGMRAQMFEEFKRGDQAIPEVTQTRVEGVREFAELKANIDALKRKIEEDKALARARQVVSSDSEFVMPNVVSKRTVPRPGSQVNTPIVSERSETQRGTQEPEGVRRLKGAMTLEKSVVPEEAFSKVKTVYEAFSSIYPTAEALDARVKSLAGHFEMLKEGFISNSSSENGACNRALTQLLTELTPQEQATLKAANMREAKRSEAESAKKGNMHFGGNPQPEDLLMQVFLESYLGRPLVKAAGSFKR